LKRHVLGRRVERLLLYASVGLILTGCNATVQLAYAPIPVASKLPAKKVALVAFADEIPPDHRTGRAKGGFGNTVRWVTIKPPVATVLSEAIADALIRSGMDVESLASGEKPSQGFVITGTVKDMRLQSKPGWSEVRVNASIQFVAKVRRPDGSAVDLAIEGIAESSSVGGATMSLDQLLANAMTSAIQDGIRKLLAQAKANKVFEG